MQCKLYKKDAARFSGKNAKRFSHKDAIICFEKDAIISLEKDTPRFSDKDATLSIFFVWQRYTNYFKRPKDFSTKMHWDFWTKMQQELRVSKKRCSDMFRQRYNSMKGKRVCHCQWINEAQSLPSYCIFLGFLSVLFLLHCSQSKERNNHLSGPKLMYPNIPIFCTGPTSAFVASPLFGNDCY